MFDGMISSDKLDPTSAVFIDTFDALERAFGMMGSSSANDITQQSDFDRLRTITKAFYKTFYPHLWRDFIPLYHSIWKLRLKDVVEIENTHQDGGVHYFSKNGFQSRMVTVWINIHKDVIPGLDPSDMGIFIVDNKKPANEAIYREMEKANTHFFQKRAGQLQDCMYVGGKVLRCDTDRLDRTYYDYEPGTSICFNSHLLHGSKRLSRDRSAFSPDEMTRFRISLASVWLHRDDVDESVVRMAPSEYEKLYLSKLDPSEWAMTKEYFGDACRGEEERLRQISALIKAHRDDPE